MRLRETPWLGRLAARAAAGWVRLVDGTTRWTQEGREHLDALRNGDRAGMILIWHGRMLMLPTDHRPGMPVHALISANRDGDLIAEMVGSFGVPSIRGSTRDPRKPDKDKGGTEAAKEVYALMRQGGLLAATPDGPRGPRMRMQPGMAALAALSRVPVTPHAYSFSHAMVLRSWDRFVIPLPFGRGARVTGAPIPPPERRGPEAMEAYRLRLEEAMNAAAARADRLMGRAPIAPAPPLDPA